MSVTVWTCCVDKLGDFPCLVPKHFDASQQERMKSFLHAFGIKPECFHEEKNGQGRYLVDGRKIRTNFCSFKLIKPRSITSSSLRTTKFKVHDRFNMRQELIAFLAEQLRSLQQVYHPQVSLSISVHCIGLDQLRFGMTLDNGVNGRQFNSKIKVPGAAFSNTTALQAKVLLGLYNNLVSRITDLTVATFDWKDAVYQTYPKRSCDLTQSTLGKFHLWAPESISDAVAEGFLHALGIPADSFYRSAQLGYVTYPDKAECSFTLSVDNQAVSVSTNLVSFPPNKVLSHLEERINFLGAFLKCLPTPLPCQEFKVWFVWKSDTMTSQLTLGAPSGGRAAVDIFIPDTDWADTTISVKDSAASLAPLACPQVPPQTPHGPTAGGRTAGGRTAGGPTPRQAPPGPQVPPQTPHGPPAGGPIPLRAPLGLPLAPQAPHRLSVAPHTTGGLGPPQWDAHLPGHPIQAPPASQIMHERRTHTGGHTLQDLGLHFLSMFLPLLKGLPWMLPPAPGTQLTTMVKAFHVTWKKKIGQATMNFYPQPE